MNYKKIAAATLLFVFVASLLAISSPTLNAQAATSMKTYSVVDAIPNKIGLGETTLLKCGITEALESADYGWTVSIIVTQPDGTNVTIGPLKTDSTGSTYSQFVPHSLGNYTITSVFPQQEMPVDTTALQRMDMSNGFFFIPKGTIMLASSASCTLEVVSEASPVYPDQPLPTEYWTRPIDDQLRSWYSVSGNWVTRPDNSLALYNDDAPETAHVLWAQDLTTGGMAGGLYENGYGDNVMAGMNTGDAYEGKFSNSVVLNGVLYYATDPGTGTYGSLGTPSIKAVDLHTGETLWERNNTVLSFGQELYWSSYNVDAMYSYIFSTSGSTWTAYDPFDGSWAYTFVNVPSGQVTARGAKGEILVYQIDTARGWMAMWNSTLAGLSAGGAIEGTPSYGSWASNVMLKTMDVSGPGCYSWNVTIPKGLMSSNSFFAPVFKVYPDRVISMFFNDTQVRVWALPTDGITATLTANVTSNQQSISTIYDSWWNAPAEWLAGENTIGYSGATNYVTDPVYGDGVIGVWDKELTTHYGFSVTTGKYLWATESENYADAYGWGNAEHTWYFAYGRLFSVGVGGILYAYDLANGHTVWTYDMSDIYGEPVTGNNWWGWIDLIADGKIYIGTLEHSAQQPMPRGAPYICINATDGSQIFRVNGLMRLTRWGGNPVIGDSIIAGMDTYDQRIYALGKGPSAVTVAASPKVSTSGSSVLIEGTVMDVSPGTKTDAMTLRFPNGVPAVSDESQSAWMLYVWKQFTAPSNATGVPLTVSVLDSNDNFRVIGETTSDASGAYSFSWVPDISGKYIVYVTFQGSGAYYASTAQSAFVVDEPAATPTPAPTAAPSMADQYFLPMSIATILAVIVLGVALIGLLLRKH